jgi:hypothetical protein
MSYLKLFNAAIIDFGNDKAPMTRKDAMGLVNMAIKHGIFLDPSFMLASYSHARETVLEAIDMFGVDQAELDATLFGDWATLEEITDDVFYAIQFLHYVSTYGGVKALANSGESFVVDPEREHGQDFESTLEAKKAFKTIEFVTAEQMSKKINDLLASGLAIDSNDLAQLFDDADRDNLKIRTKTIKNKEAKMYAIKFLGIVPENTAELMRYVLFLATGRTLLIKNEETFDALRLGLSGRPEIKTKVKDVIEDFGYVHEKELANDYFRYAEFFKILRYAIPGMSTYTNYLAKLNKKMRKNGTYQPMRVNPLAVVTDPFFDGFSEGHLNYLYSQKPFPIFQVIRATNALHLSIERGSDYTAAYRIRNGKTWIKDVKGQFSNGYGMNEYVKEQQLFGMIRNQFERVNGTKNVFRIPRGVNYALPTSAKSFLGTMPLNTIFEIPRTKDTAFVAGISWDKDADIDLSVTNTKGEHISWHTARRSDGIDELEHSGDMTRLNKDGYAAELVRFGANVNATAILSSILYWSDEPNIEQKFFVGTIDGTVQHGQPMANVNNILFSTKVPSSHQSQGLAVVQANDDNLRVIVTNSRIGGSSLISSPEQSQALIKDLERQADTALSLRDLAMLVGARVIEDDEEVAEDETLWDFSLDVVSPNTFIDLLVGKAVNDETKH